MKLIKISFLLSVAFITNNNLNMEQPKNSNKFLFNNYRERFTPDELTQHYLEDGPLKKELDKHTKQGLLISHHTNNARIEINGQEYYLKHDISRIIGAALINDIAQEYALRVRAPIKKIYRDQNGQEYCLAPVISAVKRRFTLTQVRDICKVIEVSGFNDADDNNIINTLNGTAYFIDTEERSFTDAKHLVHWSLEQRALTLDTFKETTEMTNEATKFLSKKVAQLTSFYL